MEMKRISGYIPDTLFDKIEEISKTADRSFNKTVILLLEQSVKERERQRNKRKNATKEVHS